MGGTICTYLSKLKDETRLTQQQLSDRTGIPMGTIPRYFAGMEDDSANFEIVRKLVTALGGSLDEMAGIPARNIPAPKSDSELVGTYKALLAEKDDRLAHRDRTIDYERKRSKILSVVCFAILMVFVMLFIIDLFVPKRGWILK